MGKSPLKRKPPDLSEPDLAPLYVGEWMKALGVKQHELVKYTGYAQSHIANTQAGRKANPSADLLRRIAQYLQVSMDDLYHPAPPPDEIDPLRGLAAAREALLRRITKDRKR